MSKFTKIAKAYTNECTEIALFSYDEILAYADYIGNEDILAHYENAKEELEYLMADARIEFGF